MSGSERHTHPVILVVEDEEWVRLLAADGLEGAGFSVLEAEDAQAALRILEARPDVCVVFTDLDTPGALDGMGLALRVHEAWPRVRLVLTSDRFKMRRPEIPDDSRFISKPYRLEQLVGQVQELLRG